MATYDKSQGTGMSWDGAKRVFVLKNIVDLTGLILQDNDVVQCLDIPAKTLVMQVSCVVVTQAAATDATVELGDGDGTNSWDAAVALEAAAGTRTVSAVGTDAYAAAATMGKYYAAADTIDIKATAGTCNQDGHYGKFAIYALCVDYSQ